MSNLSVKSVANRHGFVVTLEETGKGHIKVWGNGVTLAQEQAIELRDWLNERYPTQPAAGEPEQQTATNADDLPTKKYPLAAFDFDSPSSAPVAAGEQAPIGYANPKHLASMAAGTRAIVPILPSICPGLHHTEPVYAVPPAAAHGDEMDRDEVQMQCLRDLYESGYNDGQNNPNGYSSISQREDAAQHTLRDMRAQAGEGGEV